MKQGYLLGIDIGTYESKGVLTTTEGRLVSFQTEPHELTIPRPGWAEHDAEKDWWQGFCRISRDLIARSGIPPHSILAAGVSTIGPCVVPVGPDSRPLRPAILYGIDTRATKEIDVLEKSIGRDEIFRQCGNDLSSQAAGAKILWLKNHEPEIYRQAEMFVPGTSYLAWKLTGNWCIDHYTASTFVPLYDFSRQRWSEELSRGIVPTEKLPPILWTTQPAGRITSTASRATGLQKGTPVIAGTVDAAAEAVSVGVVKPGRMMLMYGSTAFMILPVEKHVQDRRLWSAPYLFEGTHSLMAGMSTTGSLTRWFRDNLAQELVEAERGSGRPAYAALSDEANSVPAGAGGVIVLPYFSGERTPIQDPEACGLIFGLTLWHKRAHLFRAVLESVGYGVRHHLDVLAELGVRVERIHAVGGGVKNAVWLQSVSDICGVTQVIPKVSLGAAYGDAFLAGLGIGWFAGYESIDGWVRTEGSVEPDAAHAELHDRQYELYRELYERTRGLMKRSRRLPGHR